MQAIKQATIPDTQQPSVMGYRIQIWNIHFQVHGEKRIFPGSTLFINFHAFLQDSESQKFMPIDVDMKDSDDEEGDVAILIGHKKAINNGDRQQLPLAHTPHYHEVCPARE
jgi:hypothetical protein